MSSIIGAIEKEILSWPGVTRQPHRFGGIEYRIGKREIGHVHDSSLADLPFPMEIRDYLVESGRVLSHHVLPQSGWVSKWIKDEDDLTQVIELFRMEYEHLNPQRL
ncbi:MAG TPA: luciferase family protein [Nitrososphaeraceae archaeon]|jgi:hypothetical protein|nr:luciferase family protein [Nitrososphaeraceae archaeon]